MNVVNYAGDEEMKFYQVMDLKDKLRNNFFIIGGWTKYGKEMEARKLEAQCEERGHQPSSLNFECDCGSRRFDD